MINLFNTASQQNVPLDVTDGRISLYVCGVTPYDTTHLGHAFTYVAFDVLVRFLRSSNIAVTYAQNVTDIDDDILRKAKELGIEYDELAAKETARFLRDMDDLNVARPDSYVPATTVMEEIVQSVQRLLDAGVAYLSDGNVYFSNPSFPGYGALAHASHDALIRLAAEHGGFPDDVRKRDPLDFLLWQKHLPGEPEWPSPFGAGRPGWHIECSTIAATFLGMPIDIHGGGSDLVFPHHASEIAQAESLSGIRPFVRHWMHTAMVSMDGEKMSKSLGNMVFVEDLLRQYSADAIRLYLLSHHYREPFEWDQTELDAASVLASHLVDVADTMPDSPAPESVPPELMEAMSDDLQTPLVVEALRSLTRTPSGAEKTAVIAWARSVFGLQLLQAARPLSASGA